MITLLDVNVLVSLAWPNHVHHAVSRKWFIQNHATGWATCPITESGFLRVSSNRRIIPEARSVEEAAGVLAALRRMPGHEFWGDDISLVAGNDILLRTVRGYRQVTDAHLLALTKHTGGALVTFDRGASELAEQNDASVVLLGL